MGMRPQAARWFELLTPREELTKALECLAETRAVELQTHSQPEHALELPGLPQALDEFGELNRRYGTWWPEGVVPPIEDALEPVSAMHDALERLRAWAHDAEPLIAEGERLEIESRQLAELLEALAAPGATLPDLHRLAEAGPVLGARFYRLPPKAMPRALPPSVITESFLGADEAPHLLAVGPLAQLEALDRQMQALKARRVHLPEWLPGDPVAAREAVEARRAKVLELRDEVRKALEALDEKHQLRNAIGTMALMEWFAGHAPSLPVTDHFAWVTGWTSDLDGHEINQALDHGKVQHLLRYKEPPEGIACPVVMHNPRWVKPFELFPSLLGTPSSTEADPSRIVALVAPLMFGFMFGDIGQGAVLLALGLWLRKRVPIFSILVPYGASSIVFGFLFGSIFSNEHLLPALWMHPIEHPQEMMVIALVFGVCILTLGLLLDALGAFWRRLFGYWLATRAGILIAYLGIVTSFLNPELLLFTWVGFTWFVLGTALTSHHNKLLEIPKALGELVETMLQLLVNTVSFVRVGAFALAHAGLSAAIMGMADATGGGIGWLLVMILGNALVIALEGLIVGIQTTRLLLFEFFIRFLTAEGRQLKPLTGPGTAIRPTGRSSS
ncbi:V-type ATP synthase subunit I [Thioalkalivibrio sp. XN279]|uniref:V-type ATP synthase subunit I n=1 Tax=Thioalkalivibrio sp. XN279 TaxID=2714953 RepID=UPI00140BE283|nr:ATPase [Thioalkalivibrio sp. XN279]NHA15419.1 ATPase [Thioalkalivibrio sp. XN279]